MAQKACFGILEEVFPEGDEGLREVPQACFDCPERVLCLKAALKTKEGLEMREGMLDRGPVGGLAGRLRRWSRKKELSRLLKQEKEKKR